jgi:HK97 family phage prohead protease
MLSLKRPTSGIALIKGSSDMVIAGYASVELVDKQGDLITRSALKDAFGGFMKSDKFRNVQLAHSNIQVGEVIDSYVDSNGRMWKSEVDDTGMFVVVSLRNDIEKAREVAAEIRKGNLQGFSIGGQAFKRVRKSDGEHGDYQEISKMELHEITICEKGINPEAQFRILKEDTNMTTENDLNNVMSRLEARLDAMEKGELPPALEASMKDKKDESEPKEEKKESKNPFADKKDEDKKDDEDMKDDKMNYAKSEYSDVITAEYLNWMEDTLKSAGVNTGQARQHFDNLEKAQLGGFDNPDAVDGADYFAGQVRGRGQENGSPSTGAINAITSSGGKTPSGALGPVSMSKGYLNHSNVSSTDIEAAYEVYKAAAMEQGFRGDLESQFANRLNNEMAIAKHEAEKAQFDARAPINEVMKSINALSERIDNIAISGTSIQKSASTSNVEVPSTQDLGNMSWDEVHNLAASVTRGA